MRSRRVDGLLFNKEEVPTTLVQRLADEGVPLVLINGMVPAASRIGAISAASRSRSWCSC